MPTRTYRYEGLGIPILEAMQAECPVVAANVSSTPEVAGDAGLLVDEVSAEAFAARVVSLEEPSVRSAAISRGIKQAKRFTWDRTLGEHFYRRIAGART